MNYKNLMGGKDDKNDNSSYLLRNIQIYIIIFIIGMLIIARYSTWNPELIPFYIICDSIFFGFLTWYAIYVWRNF